MARNLTSDIKPAFVSKVFSILLNSAIDGKCMSLSKTRGKFKSLISINWDINLNTFTKNPSRFISINLRIQDIRYPCNFYLVINPFT